MNEKKLKTNYFADEIVETEFGNILILKSIGKGKSGYSYLGIMDNREIVLKVMHDEPVPYYSFSRNKVLLESNAYDLLKALQISVPEMHHYSFEGNYIIKEYIPGITGSEWIIKNRNEDIIRQLFVMAKIMERNNYNIDYFPSNFVINIDKLFYIDYEVNNFDAKWNLSNWGIYYWANSDGFKKFMRDGDATAINIDIGKGLPVKAPFELMVNNWIKKYS